MLDISAKPCYTISCIRGHRTSASISAFQAEEVGSIPIARSIENKKDVGFISQRLFYLSFVDFFPALRAKSAKTVMPEHQQRPAMRTPDFYKANQKSCCAKSNSNIKYRMHLIGPAPRTSQHHDRKASSCQKPYNAHPAARRGRRFYFHSAHRSHLSHRALI